MKPKDPISNFYNALNDEKNISFWCLDCNAEVSVKVLKLMMSAHGRDETLHLFSFLLNMNSKKWQSISVTAT